MTETQFIENKALREKYITKFEVLEKVKKLLLIPKMECMTIRQVADFYEVDIHTLQICYERNKDEIDPDGVIFKTPRHFKEIFKFTKCAFKDLHQEHGKLIVQIDDNTTLEIPNRGIRCFHRRAILRMGMLLRDSQIAKEVRTQLLNIEEKTDQTTKAAEIDEEERLLLNIAKAYATGDPIKIMQATGEHSAYQKRCLTECEEKNRQLENDNKALSKDILEWKDRRKLNAGVRMLAAKTQTYYGALWNELYKNLQYKYGICLKQRGDKPHLQWVKESEWSNVIQTFCAMCEAYKQSPTEMFQQITPHT